MHCPSSRPIVIYSHYSQVKEIAASVTPEFIYSVVLSRSCGIWSGLQHLTCLFIADFILRIFHANFALSELELHDACRTSSNMASLKISENIRLFWRFAVGIVRNRYRMSVDRRHRVSQQLVLFTARRETCRRGLNDWTSEGVRWRRCWSGWHASRAPAALMNANKLLFIDWMAPRPSLSNPPHRTS